MASVGDGSWSQPLVLSLLAGLSTSLGAAWVFCLRSKDSNAPPLSHAHMAFALAMAGSVMVTVSFVSILPESLQDESAKGVPYQMLALSSPLFFQRCMGFGIGCFLYFLLSKCAFPEPDEILGLDEEIALRNGSLSANSSPSSTTTTISLDSNNEPDVSLSAPLVRKTSGSMSLRGRSAPTSAGSAMGAGDALSDQSSDKEKQDRRQQEWSSLVNCSRGNDLHTASARRAWRVTMLLFVSLAVHNFPEGLAVAASTMHSQELGITTTVAIALHNIPEGVAIAVPCLAARPNSPCLAFWLATISGLAEPLGALVALFVLSSTTAEKENDDSLLSMANVLAFVAGIMTTVALIELFPEARRHSTESSTPFVLGFVAGVVIMLGSDMYLDQNM
mmetsp:Transcript_11816/g.32763  ORF Transcript_11816/g.32763 Transcript_11816/m.32763 type:complete len:390 (+) Transcript_11816:111-1280(+)